MVGFGRDPFGSRPGPGFFPEKRGCRKNVTGRGTFFQQPRFTNLFSIHPQEARYEMAQLPVSYH